MNLIIEYAAVTDAISKGVTVCRASRVPQASNSADETMTPS